MKKLAAIFFGLLGYVSLASAQGTFIMDSSANSGDGSGPTASTGGLVWLPTGGPTNLDTTTDISLGVLWGTTVGGVTNHLNLDPLGLNTGAYAGCGNWIASQATGATDITFLGNGTIVDPNGESYIVPGEAAGTTIWLDLQAWTDSATSFASSDRRLETGSFSITLTLNSSPIQADIHTMPALVAYIPEPSVPVLSALAIAAFAFLRRRKSALKSQNPDLL